MSTPSHPVVQRLADILLVVLALPALALPALGLMTGIGTPTLDENRTTAEIPAWPTDREAWRKFPSLFEAYFNDHFGGRAELITGYNATKYYGLGVSPLPRVVLGKGDWLFFQPTTDPAPPRPAQALPDKFLDAWRTCFERRRDWLASRGIHYLVVIGPDKQSVYPEYLPPCRRRAYPLTTAEQIAAHLREGGLKVVEPTGALRAAKANARVYHRRDTHWNDEGAYVAYEEMAEALGEWFPNFCPAPHSAFDVEVVMIPKPDLSLMLGLPLPEELIYLGPRVGRRAHSAPTGIGSEGPLYPTTPETKPYATEQAGKGLPRAVVFQDSFGNQLRPFLSEHFARVLYLWRFAFDAGAVCREKPDVVIDQVVERSLDGPPPPDGLPPDWERIPATTHDGSHAAE